MNRKEFFIRLGRAIYHIDGCYEMIAKEYEVKENLLWILYALNDEKKHSQKEICDDWDLPRTTVNTIVKELEKEEYVKLERIEGLKREMYVLLTEKGKAFADEILEKVYEIEECVFNNFKNKSEEMIEDLEMLTSELEKEFKRG